MPRRIASESRPKQKTGRRKLIEFDEETWVALSRPADQDLGPSISASSSSVVI
jgi:hypothetical protein